MSPFCAVIVLCGGLTKHASAVAPTGLRRFHDLYGSVFVPRFAFVSGEKPPLRGMMLFLVGGDVPDAPFRTATAVQRNIAQHLQFARSTLLMLKVYVLIIGKTIVELSNLKNLPPMSKSGKAASRSPLATCGGSRSEAEGDCATNAFPLVILQSINARTRTLPQSLRDSSLSEGAFRSSTFLKDSFNIIKF